MPPHLARHRDRVDTEAPLACGSLMRQPPGEGFRGEGTTTLRTLLPETGQERKAHNERAVTDSVYSPASTSAFRFPRKQPLGYKQPEQQSGARMGEELPRDATGQGRTVEP